MAMGSFVHVIDIHLGGRTARLCAENPGLYSIVRMQKDCIATSRCVCCMCGFDLDELKSKTPRPTEIAWSYRRGDISKSMPWTFYDNERPTRSFFITGYEDDENVVCGARATTSASRVEPRPRTSDGARGNMAG